MRLKLARKIVLAPFLEIEKINYKLEDQPLIRAGLLRYRLGDCLQR